MNGLKTTSMTLEEMRQARNNGLSLSDWERVKGEADSEPAFDPDAPDASLALKEIVARGRKPGSGRKEQVAIRLDHEVLTAFRATGKGWQTRLNAALREWLKEHSLPK